MRYLDRLLIRSRRKYPIIIGGFYRSGTTLFRRLIDSHSRIHCGPEVKFFKDYFGDYIHDELAHVRFFSTARQLAAGDDMFRIFGNAYIEVHRRAAGRHKKRRWADKNPENLLYLEHWHTLLDGRFFFVHLVRHPLDALASLIEIGFDKSVPRLFEDKVSMYEKYVTNALAYTRDHPARCFVIRYEDLVRKTEEVLVDFLKNIGETFESSMLRDYQQKARRTGIEDPKVLNRATIDDQSVGRWINELNDHQVRFATKKLAPLFTNFGYGHTEFVKN